MGGNSAANLTQILQSAESEGRRPEDDVLPLVYDELRRIAGRQLAQETARQTLQPTALVHEAYLRLVGSEANRWESRGHFFAAAAEAMRRILIDRARARLTEKRTPSGHRVALSIASISEEEIPADELLAMDEVLNRLEARDARKAKVVKLKFFAGLTNQKIAEVLGLSYETIKDDWSFARAWLHREMNRDG